MKKALPIGISDFRKLQKEDYYIVDKTMMIKEYLAQRVGVTLITSP